MLLPPRPTSKVELILSELRDRDRIGAGLGLADKLAKVNKLPFSLGRGAAPAPASTRDSRDHELECITQRGQRCTWLCWMRLRGRGAGRASVVPPLLQTGQRDEACANNLYDEPTSALREYIGVSHMAFPLATSFSPTFEDVPSPKYMPSPPSSPATPPGAGDEQGKTDDKGRRLLLHQNPSYQENLRIRQRNLLSTLDHLDAKLEPLLDVDTGKAIPGFPETLRDIDKLGYDEGVRILKAVGESDVHGDEYDVLYHVRRWAATRPTENEMPGEGEGSPEDKKTTM